VNGAVWCSLKPFKHLLTRSVAAGFGRHCMPPPAPNDRYSIGPRRLRLITWSCDLDLWPFYLESGMRVTSKVGDRLSEFGHARPFGSGIIRYVQDGRTDASDRQKQRLLPHFLRTGA